MTTTIPANAELPVWYPDPAWAGFASLELCDNATEIPYDRRRGGDVALLTPRAPLPVGHTLTLIARSDGCWNRTTYPTFVSLCGYMYQSELDCRTRAVVVGRYVVGPADTTPPPALVFGRASYWRPTAPPELPGRGILASLRATDDRLPAILVGGDGGVALLDYQPNPDIVAVALWVVRDDHMPIPPHPPDVIAPTSWLNLTSPHPTLPVLMVDPITYSPRAVYPSQVGILSLNDGLLHVVLRPLDLAGQLGPETRLDLRPEPPPPGWDFRVDLWQQFFGRVLQEDP